MLTKIEIDGFKTFKDFQVELAPFQVIVGPNGSGKSNLFDALQLLSRLADKDLATAFQDLRGNAGDLFTKYPDGKKSDSIWIAVEMLVDRKVRNFGRNFELEYTRLRYELEIAQRVDEHGLSRLYLKHEALRAILTENDKWCKKYGTDKYTNFYPRIVLPDDTFFSFTQVNDDLAHLKLHHIPPSRILRESNADIQILDEFDSLKVKDVSQTVLSTGVVSSMSHAIAARKELQALKFLHLQPEAIRQPGSVNAPRTLAVDGSNLPTLLAHMQAEDKFAMTDVSRDIAYLVPGIFKIYVKEDAARNRYDLWAETSDKRTLSAQVLSDGILRLLALATLRNDPQFQGTLCLEEPENGVHPSHLNNMLQILRAMVTDFNDPQQTDEPLRQVLVTTHSPLLISQPAALDSLLITLTTTHRQGKDIPPFSITRMVPVITSNVTETSGDKALEAYTIDMVRKFLERDLIDEAEEQLKKAKFDRYER